MQQIDTSLPERLTKAILDRLEHELKALRVRTAGGGYQITISITPEISEFDIELSSRIAKVKVK